MVFPTIEKKLERLLETQGAYQKILRQLTQWQHVGLTCRRHWRRVQVMICCLKRCVGVWIRQFFISSSLLYRWCNKEKLVKARNKHNKLQLFFFIFPFLDLVISHYFFFKQSSPLLPYVEHCVWGGLVQWLLMGHQFMTRKRKSHWRWYL